MDIKEFFSPKQIYIGTLIGGPLAGIYYLSENFNHIEKANLASVCKLVGAIFTLLIFWIAFRIPDEFPNAIVPIVYSAVAAAIAWQWQVKKEEVEAAESYGFQSNWKVAGVSLVSLVITLLAIFSVAMFLPIE